jgi:hypothetical protein
MCRTLCPARLSNKVLQALPSACGPSQGPVLRLRPNSPGGLAASKIIRERAPLLTPSAAIDHVTQEVQLLETVRNEGPFGIAEIPCGC